MNTHDRVGGVASARMAGRVPIAALAAIGAGAVSLLVLVLFLKWSEPKSGADARHDAPSASSRATHARSTAPARPTAGSGARAAVPSSKVAASSAAGGSLPADARAAPHVTAASTPDVQKTLDLMEAAHDTGNTEEALRLARKLLAVHDDDVRAKAIVVLGWIGPSALPELTKLLADPVADIAADALDQWTQAVNEMDNDTDRAAMLVRGMLALQSAENLDALVMLFTQLPNDLAVRSLAQVIASNNAAAAQSAREQYEFITSTPWTNANDAESWIQANVTQE